ncbi:MAG TPA: hypothetical protein PKO09_16965 [Anaerolineae bacterium]|nr:hypothetical protein [Anaerolineae bacterium]
MGDGEMESPVGEGEQAVKTVVLFGSSLAVSSIGASLQGCAGLRVLAVDGAAHGAAQRLGALRPDVVLFDLAAVPSDFAIDLWKAQPGTLLIGMDLLAGKALVLSGRPTLARTTGDLLGLIRRHKGGDAGTRGRRDEERVTKVGIMKGTKGEQT